MLTLRARIAPLSAFGTLPKGDTFFGQLCWAARNRFGEERLRALLQSYTAGSPFAVISDAFPTGHLPRPTLPAHWFEQVPKADRKEVKKRLWFPEGEFVQPVMIWLRHCRSPSQVPDGKVVMRPQPHNAIDRRTGTTGEGFAPYAMTQHWYARRSKVNESTHDARLDLHILIDVARLTKDELGQLVRDIGEWGFGRDASIGLGRFQLESLQEVPPLAQDGADAWMTLAPCAPQGQGIDAARSFYQVFTRFGRHGDVAVYTGKPFKAPVFLAQTGAVLAPQRFEERNFIGQGLGADGSLSKAIAETVHQGYAPVVGIRLPPIAKRTPYEGLR